MKRTPMIVANWKMYKTSKEAQSYFHTFLPLIKAAKNPVYIAVPFTLLASAAQTCKSSVIRIGAQNMHHLNEGAYTGEISASMIKDAGASFVILGHSERRHHFHETDIWIHQKLKHALSENLTPILCIGEQLHEREEERTYLVLHKQLEASLSGVTSKDMEKIRIAYEPVWAIGTGKTATPEIAQEVHHYIRNYIEKHWGSEVSQKVPILYGGSVKSSNIANLMCQEDIDGALVGGASLDPVEFSKITINRC